MNTVKKRILIVHSTLHIGGAEEVTANLCNSIDKSHFDISVCYLKEKGTVGDKIEQQGIPVIGLPRKSSGKTDYFTSLKLRKVIKDNNIQLVHSHDVHSLTDCSICKLTMPSLKFVHTFHFGDYPKRAQPFKRLEGAFWRVPTKLVSVSNNQQKGIRQLYGIPEDKIETVWNGVNVKSRPAEFDVVNKCRSEGRIIIGSINTLIEQKGMFDLIDVAEKLKLLNPGKFAFLIAGDGHLKQALVEEIRVRNLQDDIILMGWVESAPIVFLPHIDIFFQPSLWEAMSMVLLEAMAEGKAIVATDVGETPYIIEDKVHGRVIKPGQIDAMLDAINKLLLDEKLRKHYGKMAKKRYIESFTADKMAARYEALYNTLLKNN